MRSGLYIGTVLHERLRPKRHRLAYRVFSLLVDLDELDDLERRFPLLGINRPGIMSFHESDHGDGQGRLKGWAAARLRENGIPYDGGRIDLLCYPRLFGFVFNPLSVFFCHDRAGRLVGILYEVRNTHGEQHTYVLPVAGGERIVRHSARKQFFVSPFMPMECVYRFRITPADEKRVGISILEDDAEGLLLTASFTGRRRELSNGQLARLLVPHPLMTFKVVAGIHWEAVKLLFKGIRFHDWTPAKRRRAISDAGLPRPTRANQERDAVEVP